MTEDEARKKWCPQIPNREARCIGSDCAAYRFVHDELTSFIANGKTVVTPSEHGYCGLAGKL